MYNHATHTVEDSDPDPAPKRNRIRTRFRTELLILPSPNHHKLRPPLEFPRIGPPSPSISGYEWLPPFVRAFAGFGLWVSRLLDLILTWAVQGIPSVSSEARLDDPQERRWRVWRRERKGSSPTVLWQSLEQSNSSAALIIPLYDQVSPYDSLVLLTMCGPLHMILPLENQDLSLLDICPVRVTFLFAFFPLEVSETTIPLDYFALLNKLCMVLLPQMHLLDCDFTNTPLLHPSRLSNMLNLLHTSASYGRVLPMLKRKF
ncbi:hypothetical protein B296_00021315 [Ensete ventricosum]|uniref:Uncharacterized protein n=1 Tax=Ensete ventricosum TaxID=4639 RepID=A0A427AEG0_ENSVE|nr:hypothetical protein B296_00021315 [Ensete ventricosum]